VVDPRYIKPDGSVSSFGFSPKPNEEGLSVNIERLTTYKNSIVDIKRFRLFALQYDYIKNLELDCIHDPINDNYAHALIVGSINRRVSRALAAHAIRIDYPNAK